MFQGMMMVRKCLQMRIYQYSSIMDDPYCHNPIFDNINSPKKREKNENE